MEKVKNIYETGKLSEAIAEVLEKKKAKEKAEPKAGEAKTEKTER